MRTKRNKNLQEADLQCEKQIGSLSFYIKMKKYYHFDNFISLIIR